MNIFTTIAVGNVLVPITMFGWIPVVFIIFAVLPPRRAVITSFLAAWLFLPMAAYDLPYLPPYTKLTATSMGVMFAILVFDHKRLSAFRLQWVDLPMVVWCVCPFVTSLLNDLGVYDGVSQVVRQVTTWGVPYFIGRLYFSDRQGLQELAIGLFIGGLIYVPFCLWEVRMSPRLHRIIYDFRQHAFSQTWRGNGYRPMVFMQHGLAVGMFMASAAVVGVWLWKARTVRQIWGVPMSVLVLSVVITMLLCKSMLATALMVTGIGLALAAPIVRSRLPVLILLLFPLFYIASRSTGLWSGQQLLTTAALVGNSQRAASLQTRLTSEKHLVAKAWKRPIFGWGGFSRSLIKSDDGRDLVRTEAGRERAIPDGLWIIAFGQYGLIGLVSMTLMILLPPILMLMRHPMSQWLHPSLAPMSAMAIMMNLYMIDCLMNALVNPIFMLACGGLVCCLSAKAIPSANVALAGRLNGPGQLGPRG